MRVFKYILPQISGDLLIPEPAHILHVGEQFGSLVIWVSVTLDGPVMARHFHVAATGEGISPTWDHIGTVQMQDGDVWHVFEGAL